MDSVLDVINSPADLISDLAGIKTTDPDMSKGQDIRVIDFAILGPFMMLYAILVDAPIVARMILFLIGLFTVTYNARNYVRISAREDKMLPA